MFLVAHHALFNITVQKLLIIMSLLILNMLYYVYLAKTVFKYKAVFT